MKALSLLRFESRLLFLLQFEDIALLILLVLMCNADTDFNVKATHMQHHFPSFPKLNKVF